MLEEDHLGALSLRRSESAEILFNEDKCFHIPCYMHLRRLGLALQAPSVTRFRPPHQSRNSIKTKVAAIEEPMVGSKKSSDERLSEFRKLLAKADKGKGVDAYIIPTEDPHMVYSSTCSFDQGDLLKLKDMCSSLHLLCHALGFRGIL